MKKSGLFLGLFTLILTIIIIWLAQNIKVENIVPSSPKGDTPALSQPNTPEEINKPPVRLRDVSIIMDGPTEVRLEETITYTLTAKNNTNNQMKDVVIRARIPAGLKYRDRIDETNLKWVFEILEPNATRIILYTVGTTRSGVFTGTAEVYIKDKIISNGVVITKVIAPDLQLAVTGPRICYLHKPLAYTITITNTGNASAKNVNITNIIPANLDYISSTPPRKVGISLPNDSLFKDGIAQHAAFKPAVGERLSTLTWKLEEVAPQQKVEIKLDLRAKEKGRCRNTAKLFCDTDLPPTVMPLEAWAETDIIGIPAMHISTYDTEDPVEVGKHTIYVIEILNEGTAPCTNIKIESKIPEEMEFVSAEGPTPFKAGTVTEPLFQVSFEPVPILQSGDKLIYKINCKAIQPGSAKHAATLTYDQFENPITDEEGTSVYK